MATYFTNWDFNKSAERAIDRNDKVKAQDQANQFRAKELGERIAAREAMDLYREKALAETIRSNQSREGLTGRGQDVTMRGQDVTMRGQDINVDESRKNRYWKSNESKKDRDWRSDEAEEGRNWKSDEAEEDRDWRSDVAEEERYWKSDESDELRHWTEDQTEKKWDREDELLGLGKTKEEREKRVLNKALLSTMPTFEEYNQDEVVDGVKDGFLFNEDLGFDEGEFRRAADQYIGDVLKNMPSILSVIERDPSNPQVVKHLDDLEMIYDIFDKSGEYSGPLDSTVFDWFEGFRSQGGEASGAKKSKAKIARILNAAGRPID